MDNEVFKDKILGYDLNHAFSKTPGFARYYTMRLLKAMLDEHNELNMVLYSNQKRKLLSSIKRSLDYPGIRFRNYLSPKRIFTDRKLAVFHSFGDFHPENRRVRKIVSLTDFSALTNNSFTLKHANKSNAGPIESLRKFDKIICPSKTAAKAVVEHLPEKAHDISVILPGAGVCPEPTINPQKVKITLGKFGINEDFFLYVGKTSVGKNIPVMIKGYIKFWQRSESVPALVMVTKAKGEVSEGLLKETALLKSKGKFIITGEIPDEELRQLYSAARALIHPVSIDMYSPQIIEAMTMGTPVICSAEGFGNELDHDVARFIDPYNIDDICAGMDAVETNPEYRTKLKEGGKRFAGSYSWNSTANQIFELYSELIG